MIESITIKNIATAGNNSLKINDWENVNFIYIYGANASGKMKNLCIEAKIPVPQFSCKGNDFWAVSRKDIYNKEDLSKLGLNERQIDAMLSYRTKGEITSSEYAVKYNVSDRTARTDLTELVDKEILVRQGDYKTTKFYFR